jgi:hypothetical protein
MKMARSRALIGSGQVENLNGQKNNIFSDFDLLNHRENDIDETKKEVIYISITSRPSGYP